MKTIISTPPTRAGIRTKDMGMGMDPIFIIHSIWISGRLLQARTPKKNRAIMIFKVLKIERVFPEDLENAKTLWKEV